jgi:hypothetical protein
MANGEQLRADFGVDDVSRIPLTPAVARKAILKCFEEKDQWTRRDLVSAIENRHLKAGGYRGTQATSSVVKRALGDLRADGLVRCVSKGLWRSVSDADPSGAVVVDNVEDEDDAGEDAPVLDVQEEVGDGDECVYLYYNPNDLRLANAEERDTWECKIGCTMGRVDERILGQGVRTALSHNPIIGLVIRTSDARALEGIIHRSLRLANSEIADAGAEWFMTSPERLKAWYGNFSEAIRHLIDDSKALKTATPVATQLTNEASD